MAAAGGRGWARAAICLTCMLLMLPAGPAQSEGQREMGSARVLEVDGDVVILGAGRMDGLGTESQVTLLREGESIVHPLTGEVLGTPQEPVATVRVLGVEDRRARGGLLRTYSEPRVDDLVEFQIIAEEPPPSPPAVDEVLRQVQELQGSVSEYQRSGESLRDYPTFKGRVWSALKDMRSTLNSLDERLEVLEEQQSEDHFRLSSVLNGEYRDEELEEITFRYSPDTQIVLEAAGKTVYVRLSRRDSTYVLEEAPAASAYEEMPPLMDEDAVDEDPDAKPWYQSQLHLAGGAGLLVALLIAATLVIRRRYNDVMGGLDDYDEEFLDDDEDEEEEEED